MFSLQLNLNGFVGLYCIHSYCQDNYILDPDRRLSTPIVGKWENSGKVGRDRTLTPPIPRSHRPGYRYHHPRYCYPSIYTEYTIATKTIPIPAYELRAYERYNDVHPLPQPQVQTHLSQPQKENRPRPPTPPHSRPRPNRPMRQLYRRRAIIPRS